MSRILSSDVPRHCWSSGDAGCQRVGAEFKGESERMLGSKEWECSSQCCFALKRIVVEVHESERSTCLNVRDYGLLAGFNVPVLDECQGHGEVANFRVSVIPVYPVIARVMAVGDYCAFIPLVAENFGHAITEVAVGVEVAARRLWIGIEDLQTM